MSVVPQHITVSVNDSQTRDFAQLSGKRLVKDRLRTRSSLRMVNGRMDSLVSRFSPIESRSRGKARGGSGRPGAFCTRVALEGLLDMREGRDGDDKMADISRVIPDGAGAIRLSPGGSCQIASRFEVTLICINDAQFQRDMGSSVKLLLCASRVSRPWRRPMVAGRETSLLSGGDDAGYYGRVLRQST
jgi:hypothetical protein